MIKPKINLIKDDALLTIAPSTKGLEQMLTFVEKKLETIPGSYGQKKVTRTKHNLFEVIDDKNPNYRIIQTYQGLWRKVEDYCKEKGIDCELHNKELPFPLPRFDLTNGYRFSQQTLHWEFLRKNMSGLLGAPTRFGKTIMIINTVRAYPGVTTVVTVPGVDLIKQLYDAIVAACPGRDVKMLGAGSKNRYPSDDITVCSMDSLDKCDHGKTKLLLIDEPHACVTDSRMPQLLKFSNARKLGFGATLTGRFDNRDILIEGIIGPVLVERTYKEAVAEGAICPLKVFMLKIKLDNTKQFRDRLAAYKALMYVNKDFAKLLTYICKEVLPADWQTIIFIKNEDQADCYQTALNDESTIAMAKKLTTKEREAVMEAMTSNTIKRCLASEIYSAGVTFHDVRAMVNCSGGGPYTSTIQKPGRLAEIRPGKKSGVIIDFMFYVDDKETALRMQGAMISDSVNRFNTYKDKGYEVTLVDRQEDLSALVQQEC